MRGSPVVRALALLVIVFTAVSCDSITGNGGSFTLTLSDTTLNLGQGKTDTVVITLSRSSYTKPISLSVDGVPAGVTANLLAPTVPGNSSVTGMELIVSPTATLDTAKLTVHATGAGVAERTASFDVAVGITGTFSLSSDGFPVTAAQGGGGVATVLVTRSGGHADNVTLAATGLPSGVTATFGTSPTTAGSTPVTIAAASGAVPGNYNFTITGTAQGLTQQQIPVSINIIAPPATASLSMSFCAAPLWFAYQNQGQPWQSVASGTTVTFQATATLAVAYVFTYSSPPQNDMFVSYATRDELAARGTDDCPGSKTLSGTISGASAGQSARIGMGAIDAVATQSSPNFTLSQVASRTLDLIATKGTISIDPVYNFYTKVVPDQIVMQRALNPASGTSLGTIDFAGQGFAPSATNLTIANVSPSESIHVANTFRSSTGTHGVTHIFETTTSTGTLYSMPGAKFAAGDMHELLVETYVSGFSSGRFNYSYLGPMTDRTETLSPQLSTPIVTAVTSSPYTRMRGTLPVQAEYPALVQFGFGQGGNPERWVYVVVSAGFLGATPASSWDAAVPEFGSVAGLSPEWLLSTSFLTYYVEADGGTDSALFGAPFSIGDTMRWAFRYGSSGSLLRAGVRTRPRPGPAVTALRPRQYFRR